jgi:CRISPR/Cas system-associated exonuclease Cas4 (RecB family)
MATKQLNIRPSGIGRTIACPASVRLSAQVPYQESGEAAKIGTAIHALAEHCFKDQSDPMLLVGTVVEGITMTEENCDFAKQYLDAIFNIYNEVEWACEGEVEKFLPYQDTPAYKCGGTADFIGISTSRRKLIIADLKTGRGYVDADSEQLKLYALAAMESGGLYKDIDTIELQIIQPHHGEVRKHTMTTQELVDWEHYILQPAIENVLNPLFPPVPSDSACQYCAAKTICPAQANIVETVVAAPPVEVLTEEQISVLLMKFDMVEDYIKAVRDHALKRMESGAVIAGWQLAPKRALRSWTSEDEAYKGLLALGLNKDQVMKTELITPAAAEKLLTKDLKPSLEPLTSRISSGLTLARDKGLRQ